MEDKTRPAPKRPLTALARVQRRSRIFARLREGCGYDEIAEDERLTAERSARSCARRWRGACPMRTPTTPSSSSTG